MKYLRFDIHFIVRYSNVKCTGIYFHQFIISISRMYVDLITILPIEILQLIVKRLTVYLKKINSNFDEKSLLVQEFNLIKKYVCKKFSRIKIKDIQHVFYLNQFPLWHTFNFKPEQLNND
jgi:hypothetical protein